MGYRIDSLSQRGKHRQQKEAATELGSMQLSGRALPLKHKAAGLIPQRGVVGRNRELRIH